MLPDNLPTLTANDWNASPARRVGNKELGGPAFRSRSVTVAGSAAKCAGIRYALGREDGRLA